MNRSTAQWTISLPPVLSQQALKLAQQESRTKSELIREALRYYMERRTLENFRRKLSRQAQSAGIQSEADVENLIDENRAT
jgi:predicted DNA-binding protein